MVQWADGVNKKAYGMSIGEVDNIIYTEFESGKARTRKKNSIAKSRYSFLLLLDDTGNNSEYKKFLHWWKFTLQSGAQSFLFPNLDGKDEDTEYRVVEPFEAVGQRWKEVSLSVEEV